MRIVVFGSYQADAHPRVTVLIEGLRSLGNEVIEINEPLGLSTKQRVSILRAPWKLPVLCVKLASAWIRLARRGRDFRRRECVDAVLVGYLGHFDVHLAKRVFKGSTIVLDHLIFAAGTARDRGAKAGATTKALELLDRRALAAADVIVLDTEEHRRRVPAQFADRTVVCHVGADHRWFDAGQESAPDPAAGEPVRAVFYGLFTPLQGAVTIGIALRVLADRGVRASDLSVTMIGAGQDLAAAMSAAGDSQIVQWRDWVAAADLPSVVASHHVALGIFGTTVKGAEVVPNKVYQSAAAGCALITSDTPPQRRLLAGATELVPPGDAEALAAALERFITDRATLAERRRQAVDVASREFSPEGVTRPLAVRLSR